MLSWTYINLLYDVISHTLAFGQKLYEKLFRSFSETSNLCFVNTKKNQGNTGKVFVGLLLSKFYSVGGWNFQ